MTFVFKVLVGVEIIETIIEIQFFNTSTEPRNFKPKTSEEYPRAKLVSFDPEQ